MDTLEPVRQLAAYNRWMNERLYAAAEQLPAERRFEDRGAFFRSVGGTLNHLVVGDSLWLRRFSALRCAGVLRDALDWLPAPRALDALPYPDWDALRRMRARIDALISAWVDGLRAEDLDEVAVYSNTAGTVQRRPLGLLLVHFFNHQTHHRAQAGTLLHQCDVDPGVTDLVAILPQAED